MQYASQAIVLIAPDLRQNAVLLQDKRVLNGEAKKSILVEGVPHVIPKDYRYTTSRLIIVGHGDSKSQYICDKEKATRGSDLVWEPQELAQKVYQWLDNCQIQRISLHMCYGGGNRTGLIRGPDEGVTDFANRFSVSPFHSFAYNFAGYCGLAETITARTETVHMQSFYVAKSDGTPDMNRLHSVQRVVGPKEGEQRHKEKGDKITITPDPNARPNNRCDPKGITM